MKTFAVILTSVILTAFASAQDTKSRIDSSDISLPSPAKENAQNKTGGDASSNVTSSDTGAQRPLSLSKTGFSGAFGYESKYSYKENPLGAPGVLDQQADAVWENSFYGNAKLNVIELDSSVVTPYIGARWSLTDFTYKNDNDSSGVTDLSAFNFNSTTAYLLFLMQHESGWAFRGGVMYANDRSTEKDTEDYMEFYPSVGATKAYPLNENALGIFDVSLGSHYGDVEDADDDVDEHTSDELDHVDVTASYSIIYTHDSYTITPSYSISYRKYENGFNSDRDDLFHNLRIVLDYPIAESFDLSIFSDYSKRESNGNDSAGDALSTIYDFEKFDLGAGISLEARF